MEEEKSIGTQKEPTTELKPSAITKSAEPAPKGELNAEDYKNFLTRAVEALQWATPVDKNETRDEADKRIITLWTLDPDVNDNKARWEVVITIASTREVQELNRRDKQAPWKRSQKDLIVRKLQCEIKGFLQFLVDSIAKDPKKLATHFSNDGG